MASRGEINRAHFGSDGGESPTLGAPRGRL